MNSLARLQLPGACALVGLLLLCAACPPPPPAALAASREQPCPVPPPAMGAVEELKELARATRELRANLMTRLEGPERTLFATLHPPLLSLAEAVLANPKAARELEPRWVRQQLWRAEVTILAPDAIAAIDGDVSRVLLVVGEQQAHPLLIQLRTDSQGWTYHLLFDPWVLADLERDVVELRLQVDGVAAQARWSLRRSTLTELTDFPLIFTLQQRVQLRRARWLALAGEPAAAREEVAELVQCAPGLAQAAALDRALQSLSPQAVTPPQAAAASDLPGAVAGRPLAEERVLRQGLLQRLAPAAGAGLLPAAQWAAAIAALEEAGTAQEQPDAGWRAAEALARFDTQLAEALVVALDERTLPGPLLPVPPAAAAAAIGQDAVDAELERRLAKANALLLPRWLRAPGDDERPGHPSYKDLQEMRPQLEGQAGGARVLVLLRRQLGWGWLSLGLPPLDYSIRLADAGGEYWRREAASARDLPALQRLARRLLERELTSDDPAVAALALAGWQELKGDQASERLLKIVNQGEPEHAGPALRTLALQRNPQITAALLQAARAAQPALRAAAMHALGRRQLAEERGLLRAGLDDPVVAVAAAALEGLLRRKDPDALTRARAWLAGDNSDQQQAVLQLASQLPERLQPLRRELLSRLQSPTAAVVRAVVAVLGGEAAQPLTRLFAAEPQLRLVIVQAVAGAPYEALLRQAAADEAEVELRWRAIRKLAALPRPPRQLLEQALEDPAQLVRLAAHAGLAEAGRAESLLALGQGARGSCQERELVLPTLVRALDSASRRQLLLDGLLSGCNDLLPLIWKEVLHHQPEDIALLKAALGHSQRKLRVLGSLAALGLRSRPALGQVP